MANLKTAVFADAIKTAYEKRLLLRAIDRLVHGKWGSKARLSKNNSLELRKYSGLSAVTTPLIEGTTPSEQVQPALTKIVATPAWYGAWIGYTDIMPQVTIDPIISETMGILGEQAGMSIDLLHRSVLIAGATTDYSGGASLITDLEYPTHEFAFTDLLVQYAELLAANAMPMEDGCYPVIIHPYTYITLFNDPVFVNLFTEDQPDSKGIRFGYVGRLMNMKFYVTANAYVQTDAGASSADVYSALIIGRESYGSVSMAGWEPRDLDSAGDQADINNTGKVVKPIQIIAKPIGSAGADDPLDQRGTLAWKTSFVSHVLNADWIRNCKHVNMFS